RRRKTPTTVARVNRRWSLMAISSGPTGQPVGLVDQTGDARTIVNADGRRHASPKVVERVAQRGQGEWLPGLPGLGFVSARRREPQRAVAEPQDRVAPRNLPLAVGAV